MSFTQLWESLLPVGRHGPTGGYRRYSFTEADAACRQWFAKTAAERELRLDHDRNGNLWAWWDGENPGRAAIVDRQPSRLGTRRRGLRRPAGRGVRVRRARRAPGARPDARRPVGVAAFSEEEGARFGVACLGSRLLTGAIDPARRAGATDGAGVSLAEAMTAPGSTRR